MSTQTLAQLRTEAEQLLRLTDQSSVQQILANAIGQANNGTLPDPDATTDELLAGISTWKEQSVSDVDAIIANQVMRLLRNNTGIRAVTPAQTAIIAVGDILSVDVSVPGASAGDLIQVAPRTFAFGDYYVTGRCLTDGTVNVQIRNMSSILAANLVNVVFNILVTKY